MLRGWLFGPHDFFFIGASPMTIRHSENPLVYAWQVAFHMCRIDAHRFSFSAHMQSKFLAFASLLGILNHLKWHVESLLMEV